MRYLYHPLLFLLVILPVATSCHSESHSAPDDIHWVYGRPFPFLPPIKQTNLEIEFFETVDLMIRDGLRDLILPRKESVCIELLASWQVFSYPQNVHLDISTEVYEDVVETSGWLLDPSGVFGSCDIEHPMQTVLVRQMDLEAGQAHVTMTMLLRMRTASSTNFVRAVLSCVWIDGALEWRGLRVLPDPTEAVRGL